jgi:hypothetical protein
MGRSVGETPPRHLQLGELGQRMLGRCKDRNFPLDEKFRFHRELIGVFHLALRLLWVQKQTNGSAANASALIRSD